MSKYKEGDKIVLEIISGEAYGDYLAGSKEQNWWFNAEGLERGSEPLGTYTEPLERKNENKQKQIEKLVDKLHRQAAEITRLLAENKELKDKLDNRCDMCIERHEKEVEQARAEGAEAAWELAKKIILNDKGCYSGEELKEIFGYAYSQTLIRNYTYKHAAAKIAEWEKGKEEIKVGDVFQDDDGNNAIVTSIKGNTIYYMWDDGDTRSGFAEDVKKHFTKTGRHIDIDGFLKQIGGEEE